MVLHNLEFYGPDQVPKLCKLCQYFRIFACTVNITVPGTGRSIWSGRPLCRQRWCACCAGPDRIARRCCSPGAAARILSPEQIRLNPKQITVKIHDI
jgi:hypothetical protein